MASTDIGSIQPNPYLFKIDSQRNRRAKLAHEAGAGAKCKKCGDKCRGFELHFWRKICINCRCSKDDHEIQEDEEDIGKIVIGKLFNRPIRTPEEEESYSHDGRFRKGIWLNGRKKFARFRRSYQWSLGIDTCPGWTNLEIVDFVTGKREEMVFDWIPPGVAKNLATRYMEMLPPDKRPVTGTQAARDRRKQLEQQLPLYDMDENERCENMPLQEYQNFQQYMDKLKSHALGQASVQEILKVPESMAVPLTTKKSQTNMDLNEPMSNLSLQSKNTDNQKSQDPNFNSPSHPIYSKTLPKPLSHVEKSRPFHTAQISSLSPCGSPDSNNTYPTKPSAYKQGSLKPNTSPTSLSTPCTPLHRNVPAASGFYAAESNANVILPQESQILRKPRPTEVFHCETCQETMIPGDVAVLCDKAGSNKFWHPNCFVCTTCNELLADLIYFYKDSKIYCGRHYHEASNIPRCHACDELIFSDSWTRADGFDWHIHHYCCFICDKPLAGHKYIPDERSYPHCMSCYMAFMAKMCETCEQKISPQEPRAGYHGYFYHGSPSCFSCYCCKKSLLSTRFKMVKNWVFCSQDCINECAEDVENNPNEKERLH